MLGADLLGFHTFDDARHFRSAATRVLRVQSLSNIISYNDRQIVIESFPMGIDNKKFEALTTNEKVLGNITELKESFDAYKNSSIDRQARL